MDSANSNTPLQNELDILKKRIGELERELLQCRLSEDRFRTVSEYANDWIYWISPEGTYYYMSPSCERITGYSVSEFLENPELMDDIIHPDDRSIISLSIPEELDHGHLNGVDFRIITKTGEERWVNHVCQPVHDSDGRFQGSRASNRDVTERKMAEKEIQTILQTTNEGFIQFDNKSLIIKVNPAMCRIMDMEEENLLGQSLTQFLDEKSVREFNHQLFLLDQGKTGVCEMVVIRPDGSKLYCLFNTTPTYNLKGEKLSSFAMVSDLTRHKRLEIELRKAKRLAESSNLAKSKFLARMSHEIRSPLNSIVGFSQILLKKAQRTDLPPDFRHYLENIRTSGENLTELISNILDLSKIEAGKTPVTEEDINLKLLVQGIFHINLALAINKDVNMKYEFDPGLPEFIRSDRTKLHQILMNLVSNAIKFTPPKKNVFIKAKRVDHDLIFEINDEGIGIDKDKQKQIFEAFEQVDESMSRFYGGSGLGLTIVKSATELLKGDLQLKSEAGKGSAFTVRIPFIPPKSPSREQTEISWEDLQFSPENKVLVVEDDATNLEMIEVLFKEIGIEIEKANDGRTGIQKALERQPDLILMDLHMPGMDGIEATQEIRTREEGQNLPVVVLSADAFSERRNTAIASGVSDYLTKPLDLKKLAPILSRYLKAADSHTSVSRDIGKLTPMPDSIREQLLSEFQILAEIPPYDAKGIKIQVEKMLVLCNPYDSPYYDLLIRIRHASLSGNSQNIPSLLKEISYE